MEIKSLNFDETYNIGVMCASEAKAGDVFCLTGDLGVGKTVFAKGFAHGLLVEDEITSPTFTIVNEYDGRFKFYHFDLYRIEDENELFNIGFEDYVFGKGVCLIEWPKMAESFLPKNVINITITKDLSLGENYRLIKID